AALLGVANLRGTVVPMASLHVLLGVPVRPVLSAARAIVLDVGLPAAIVVDAVATLESPDPERIENPAGDADTTHVVGVFPIAGTGRVARILDIRSMLDAAFTRRARTTARDPGRIAAPGTLPQPAAAQDAGEMLVTFEVAGQEFALPLSMVQEVLAKPAQVTDVARADAAVVGMTSVRDRLLPLLSLRTLLGFAPPPTASSQQKVVVLRIGDSQVGLVADRARSIVRAPSF